MPRTAEDVETFLDRLDRTFESKGGTFVVSTGRDGPPVAVRVADPIVIARVDIGTLPKDDTKRLATCRKLLEYNATDLVHAAYGLEGDEIVRRAIETYLATPLDELRETLGGALGGAASAQPLGSSLGLLARLPDDPPVMRVRKARLELQIDPGADAAVRTITSRRCLATMFQMTMRM